MQLKMSEPFNFKLASKLLQDEDKFISNIFSKMCLPIPGTTNQEQEDESDDEKLEKKKAEYFSTGEKARRAQTFEELHEKLDELRGQKKLGHKERLLKKGLKNRIKKKTRREERAMQKKLARTEKMAAGTLTIKDEVEAARVPKPKPIFNSEGNMVFSKFDFSEVGAKKKPPKSGKDPKKMLRVIEEKNKKVKELENAGLKDKAEEIKEKLAWKAALSKASGEKVRDDPDLLKRTIKKEEQKKNRSAKKWELRIQGVEKTMLERQQKRQENIMKRKKDKKTNKLKKASKKGRVIPGF